LDEVKEPQAWVHIRGLEKKMQIEIRAIFCLAAGCEMGVFVLEFF